MTHKPILYKLLGRHNQNWYIILSDSSTSARRKGSRFMEVNFNLPPDSYSSAVDIIQTTFPGGCSIEKALRYLIARESYSFPIDPNILVG